MSNVKCLRCQETLIWVLDFIVEFPWKHFIVQYGENVCDTLTENILAPYYNGAPSWHI